MTKMQGIHATGEQAVGVKSNEMSMVSTLIQHDMALNELVNQVRKLTDMLMPLLRAEIPRPAVVDEIAEYDGESEFVQHLHQLTARVQDMINDVHVLQERLR